MTSAEASVVINRYTEILKKIYEALHPSGEINRRRGLLLSSILRVQAHSRAVLHLSEICGVEEIWSLGRTVSEVVVNATYLQIADEIEVERFEKFDFSNIPKQTTRLRKHLPYNADQQPDLEDEIKRIAAEAKSLTGRGDKDSSWSQYGIVERAEITDKRIGLPVLKTMVLTESPYGHSAVHGTFFTFGWFLSGLAREHDVPDADRMQALGVAMHGLAFVLMNLCMVLEKHFKLGMRKDIEVAGKRPT